jgi:hypothetical protein
MKVDEVHVLKKGDGVFNFILSGEAGSVAEVRQLLDLLEGGSLAVGSELADDAPAADKRVRTHAAPPRQHPAAAAGATAGGSPAVKQAPAQGAKVGEQPVISAPPALATATSFRQVMQWVIDQGLRDPAAIEQKLGELHASVPVLQRLGGDLKERIARALTVMLPQDGATA